MNEFFNRIFFFGYIALSFAAFPISAETELKGMAVLERLQQPVYYAATSGLPPASAAEFEKNPMPFSMYARYAIEKISARRNSQLWLNALLVSSGREEIKKMEQAVLIFKAIVRNEMHKGDELTFEIQPAAMTVMRINGAELAQVKSVEFQHALVKYWFGDRLTSKQFAQDIRQRPSARMMAEYINLIPDSRANARAVAIRNSLTSQLSNGQPQVDTKLAANQTNTNTKASTNQQSPKVNKVAKQDAPQSNQKQTKTSNSTQSKPATKRAANNNPQKSTNKTNTSSTNDKTAKTNANKVATADSSKKEAIGLNDSLFTQLFASLREDYLSEVTDYVQLSAKPTPSRKVRKVPKENAKLQVKLRFSGERMQVEGIEVVEGDFDELLVEALKESVTNLKKIPVAPEAIRSESFTLNVALNFAKCKRSTSAWICF